AGAGGGAEHATGGGDVPALRIMARRDDAADPAFDLEAEDESAQQLGAADPPELGEREQRRRYRRGRMDHRSEMSVAKVEHVGAGGIEEGRAQRIDALAAT